MEMDFKAKDSFGVIPDMALIGRVYRHLNGNNYIVGGWSFDATRQRWMIGYKAVPAGKVVFTRLPEDFFGKKNQQLRFIRVETH